MLTWLDTYIRAPLARFWRDERGQGTEFLIIVLLVFIIFLISTGRRVVVQ
jgi:hypothetical protein